MDLEQVLDVFTDPATASLHERQSAVLRRLLRDLKNGFTYRQLPCVCQLLDQIWSRIEGGAEQFVPQLNGVMRLVGLPIIREKSNEEFLGGLEKFEELIRTVEKFLHVPVPSVQIATCKALQEVALGRDTMRTNNPVTLRVLGAGEVKEDLRKIPRELNQSLLLKAGVVSGLSVEIEKQVMALSAINGYGEQEPEEPVADTTKADSEQQQGEQQEEKKEEEEEKKKEEEQEEAKQEEQDPAPVVVEEEVEAAPAPKKRLPKMPPATLVEPGGMVRTTMDLDDFDSDDDDEGGAPMFSSEHLLKATSLSVELVSTIPSSMRALLLALTNLMRELSGNLLSSADIVASGGMHVIASLLGVLVGEPRDPLINTCIIILWNCLEHSSAMLDGADAGMDPLDDLQKCNAMLALSNEETLSILRDLLQALFATGHREKDKELRNEVLIVASFIAREKSSHVFFRMTGLLDLLLTFATAAEKCGLNLSGAASPSGVQSPDGPLPPPADLHNFATAHPPDMELKRLLWALLSDLSKEDPENLACVVASDLLEVLIMYLNVDLQLVPETAFATVASLTAESRRDATAYANPTVDAGEDAGFTVAEALPVKTTGGTLQLPLQQLQQQQQQQPQQQGSPPMADRLTESPSFLATNVPMANDDRLQPPSAPEEDDKPIVGGTVTPAVITRLPRTQLRVLQQQAMAVLLNLVLKAPEKFKNFAGHIIVLRFLDYCSAQGREARQLVQGALMLMLCFVALPGLQDELGQLDAVRIMLARFNDQNAPASLRADAVCIMSKLCIGHEQNQATFRQVDGIVSLTTQVEQYARGRQVAPREKKGGLAPGTFGLSGSATEKVSPLLVGVVDCLWNSVAGNARSEARLLSTGGIDALLNLLEVCPILMRHQITGLLADLCENGRIVPYVKAWRSDRTMKTAVQLLMHLFEDEEVRLAFDRPDGVVTNLWEPLRKHAAEQASAFASGSDDHAQGGATGGVLLGVPSGPGAPVLPGSDKSVSLASSTAGGNHGAGLPMEEANLPGRATGNANMGSGGKAFARLENALQQSASHKAEKALRKAIELQDLRAKITAIVTRIGFEFAAEGLAAPERATLLMAQHYVQFRMGESWVQVRDELRKEGVKPIAADSFLLESKIENNFDAARKVKCEQMLLSNESREEAKEKEAAFFETVKLQRDQEIRMEQIKRSALVPKSLKKKQAEKEAQEKMMEDSMVDPGPEADTSRILHALERKDELSTTPLAMHTFELPQSAKPWTYEDTIKEAVCEGGRIRLVRWHISGPGEGAKTVAVEAVTYDPEYEQDTTES